MKMTVEEARERLETCNARLRELQSEFYAERQKSVYLQGYIQALTENGGEEGAAETAPDPPKRLKAV